MLSLLLGLSLINVLPAPDLPDSRFLDEFFAFKLESENALTGDTEEEVWYIDGPDFYMCPDESSTNLNAIPTPAKSLNG